MIPRQRILATLAHERPDRTPTDGWFHPEIIAKLKRHFRTDDWGVVLERLGITGWGHVKLDVRFPEYAARATPRPKAPPQKRFEQEELSEAPADAAEARMGLWLDNDTYENEWGVRRRLGLGGRYEQWVSGPLQNIEAPEQIDAAFRFPTPADVVWSPAIAAKVAQLKANDLYVHGGMANVFTQTWAMRGYENALMDYLANPELLEAIYDRFFAIYTEMVRQLARADVDMIDIVGDVSMQDRIIMGADSWRKHDKPRYARLIADARAIKRDIVFFFHSDGCLLDLMDDLVEIGFTVINPIQPECMEPRLVKRRWGDRITMHGCISIQRVLPFGSAADVRAEVDGLIRDCGQDGGLILMPSNVIQPDTPLENVLACYEAARQLL